MKQGFQQIAKNTYQYSNASGPDIKLYLSPLLFEYLEPGALEQLINASQLPSVVSPVVGLPDIHEGFGLPIGGVLATQGDNGIISAGSVGMDINCGVRLLATDLTYNKIKSKLAQRLADIAELSAPGVGKTTRLKAASRLHIHQVLEQGVPFLVEKGIGSADDLGSIEEGGVMPGADKDCVSKDVTRRGQEQLATLGGGNHFIEACLLETDYHNDYTRELGLEKGVLYFLIHTGSRGVGHQVCTDYMDRMKKALPKGTLPTKGLAYAPLKSKLGQEYFSAMSAACNFAFSNRQLLTVALEQGLNCKTKLIYDVSHNIAKLENHGGKNLLIHRKGATRALPKGHQGLGKRHANTGQPAIIPGTMGTGSYVVVGTEKLERTFYSVNHGAGRLMSRKQAKKSISPKQLRRAMSGIELNSPGVKKVLDESPHAYKDIDAVVDVLADIGLVEKVAKLRPVGVIKG